MPTSLFVEPEVSLEEKKAALEFALQSDSLNRSDRLKSLLRYVCEADFSNNYDRLSEYEIAVSALGRRSDFSPLEDSTVRSRAYELRQKLEKLYAVEAPQYPIRIDLPKGSYRPKFHRVTTPLLGAIAAVAPSVEVSPSVSAQLAAHLIPPGGPEKQRFPRSAATIGLVCFLGGALAASTVALISLKRSVTTPPTVPGLSAEPPWTPELRQLWAPLISGSKPMLVTFETRLFVAVGPLVVRDPDLESIHDLESSKPIMQVKQLFNVPQVYEARRYADFSVADALFSIAQLLSTSGVPLKAHRSASLTSEEVHANNLVLIGKPGAYDGVKDTPPGAVNFVFDDTRSLHTIHNLHPRAGEQAVYSKTVDAAASGGLITEYGLVSMSPGPEKGQHIMNLIGAESEIFWPLGIYVTNPICAKELVDRVRLPSGRMPDSYEVLVKAQFRGDGPIQVSYVTHRVLNTSN